MILKDDDRVTVEETDGLIVKSFKPGHEVIHSLDWVKRINEFSLLYGHTPKIVDYTKTPNRLVTTKVVGDSLTDLIQKKEIDTPTDLTNWIHNYKKAQMLYFEMITHFAEFNANFEYPLVHNDLRIGNLYIQDNTMVCIDIDSMFLSENAVEFNWISMPFTDMVWIENKINTLSLTEKIKKSLN